MQYGKFLVIILLVYHLIICFNVIYLVMISCIITRRLLINNNQFDYLLPVVKNKEDVNNNKNINNIYKNYLFYNKYLRDCMGLKTLKNRKKKTEP